MKSWEYQEAIFASNLSSKAKLVGLAIAYHYNWKESRASFPSIETLCERTSLSKASVHRAKQELVSQGYLDQQRKAFDSNRYFPQTPLVLHPETHIVSQGRRNYELNNELNNVLSESSFQSDSDSVILKDIIAEEIKEIEDDSANWTDAQRRAWFLSQPLGTNKNTGESRPVSTRDNKYLKTVPEFLRDVEEARASEW